MIFDDMHKNFETLKERLSIAIKDTNLDAMFKTLSSIKEPTLVTGVGGSSIVATYLAKVLREKNNIIATFAYPRDIEYMNLSGYKNIISVSYSGGNIGVDASFNNNLNKYLFTGHARENVNNIVYSMPEELSYVSIAATIIPLSLITLYYKNDINIVNEIVDKTISTTSNNKEYEVMYGYETNTAATLLESSIIESGMASIVLHEKYNYAHGRMNTTKNSNSDLIFFKANNEYDDLLLEKLPELYKNIIVIDKYYEDDIVNDYCSCVLGLKLCEAIADNKHCSISDPGELPLNDVFYLYKGKLK